MKTIGFDAIVFVASEKERLGCQAGQNTPDECADVVVNSISVADFFGSLPVTITSDIIEPIGDDWEADRSS